MSRDALATALFEARALLARPGNDFSWSSWEDEAAALKEIDAFIASVTTDKPVDRLTLEVLFAATGPIQEAAMSSGWADEYLVVAERFDRAIEHF